MLSPREEAPEAARSCAGWLRPLHPPTGAPTLYCFPHAGGSAASYREWSAIAGDGIDLVAVQLPGREGRYADPVYEAMGPLVADLVEVLTARPEVGRGKYAFFGCSMGAHVAHALTHALRERDHVLPSHLFVASSPAPSAGRAVRAGESDDDLVGVLRDLGGTPDEVLANAELLAVVLPTLRADLRVMAGHRPEPRSPLPVPIHAFAGTQDLAVPASRMSAWVEETRGDFSLTEVDGGHIPGGEGLRSLLASVRGHLGR